MIRITLTPIAATAALLALAGCSKPAQQQSAAATTPTAPSSEWVAENPTEPAVPVNLPNASATGAANAKASPAATAATPTAR